VPLWLLLHPCLLFSLFVTTPLWPSVAVKPNTPKVGDLESSGTPECLEFYSKAQNTLHWGVLGVIEKVLKCKYRKWPRSGHLDICSPNYGQKKGRESNWQFDSRPLKVRNRPAPDMRWGSATCRWKDLRPRPDPRWGRGVMAVQSPGSPTETHSGQLRDSISGVPGKSDIRMPLPWANAEYTIGSMVVASPEPGPWCVS
jgi:hypothetical protein